MYMSLYYQPHLHKPHVETDQSCSVILIRIRVSGPVGSHKLRVTFYRQLGLRSRKSNGRIRMIS